MNLFEIFLLALALAMDALSVSIMAGIKGCCAPRQILRMSGAFGFFQFLMPILGWLLASQLYDFIMSFAPWLAFFLLFLVGVKMLWEARSAQDELQNDPTQGLTLIMLAIATSIDALAVGISFAALNMEILWTASIIGIVCFIMTALGMKLSNLLVSSKGNISKYANIIGGLLLISIGVKILLEHIFI